MQKKMMKKISKFKTTRGWDTWVRLKRQKFENVGGSQKGEK